MTRALYIEYPEDRNGTWFDYFTKEKIESTGMWISRKVDLKTMPIFVKTVLCVDNLSR